MFFHKLDKMTTMHLFISTDTCAFTCWNVSHVNRWL